MGLKIIDKEILELNKIDIGNKTKYKDIMFY